MRSEVNVKVSLFQKDGISYALVLSSIIFELLFSVKILDVIAVNWLIGVSTILNIILLFLLFSCAVKVNVYKVGWAVCALSIAGYAVIRACVLLPLLLKPVSDVPGLVLDNAGLACFLGAAGVRSLLVSSRRRAFMKTKEARDLLCVKER